LKGGKMQVFDQDNDIEYKRKIKLSHVIKSWCSDIEEGAWKQALNLAHLPFIHRHVALMSDAHQGFGMPIGGVIATKDVIIPHAVGSDISCGMVSCKTSLTEIDVESTKKIMGGIRSKIPVGFSHHSKKQGIDLMPDVTLFNEKHIVFQEFESALKQLGTLGGNNHFIELQKGSDGHIWIMIHSGSRNLGYKVADHYNKVAIKLNEKWHTKVPKEWQLAFLPMDSDEGQMYFEEMNYCTEFALANRKLMMERIKECFLEVFPDVKFDEMINIHHNFAAMENHFGENVLVHRKGATLARKGTIGIIPGSQGTASYIVEGLGNPESFMSCSHGSGRKMSRTKAKNELNLEDEIKLLDDQGIVHGIRHKNDLDEAAGAYKNIEDVISQQLDLIKVLVKLKPLAVIKG